MRRRVEVSHLASPLDSGRWGVFTVRVPPQRNTGVDGLLGQVLAGRYRVLERLGAGGMASVYLAEHVTLGKRVAIKMLNDDLCRDRSHVDRFLQEARAASMINHENIVDIIDFGTGPRGSVFYAMELLEGETLSALLRREGRIPWARAREIMIQIATALGAAHGKGVIHRDLKPANCFLVRRADGRPFVKVLDFGIARVNDPQSVDGVLTVPGTILGTAKYMAPEQACGAPADARTDVYAAAVCLYELLTGSVPYDGDNFLRTINRHITEPLTPPTTRAPDAGISFAVEAVIVKALAKKPADRYQTMAELREALCAIGLDGNLVAPPDPGPPKVGPGVARPNGSGPTGTIWLGPPRGAVATRTPTLRFEAPTTIAAMEPTQALAMALPPPPSPRPPTDLPKLALVPRVEDTRFGRPHSPVRVVAAAIAGAVLAIAAGALVAWWLIGGWIVDPVPEPRPAGAQPAPQPVEPNVAGAPMPVDPPAEPTPNPSRPHRESQASKVEHALALAPAPKVEPTLAVASPPKPAPTLAIAPAPRLEPERGVAKPRSRDAHRERTAVDIARGFARARKRARACMRNDDGAPPRISVRAVLGPSGKVLHAEVLDDCDPALASCIQAAVETRARFTRADDPLDVRYWTFSS